jgi:hypothetical protein
MPSTIEDQIANYCSWVEDRSNVSLRPPAGPGTDDSDTGRNAIGDEAPVAGFGRGRATSLVLAAAVVVGGLVLVGALVAVTRPTSQRLSPVTPPASEAPIPTTISRIDPQPATTPPTPVEATAPSPTPASPSVPVATSQRVGIISATTALDAGLQGPYLRSAVAEFLFPMTSSVVAVSRSDADVEATLTWSFLPAQDWDGRIAPGDEVRLDNGRLARRKSSGSWLTYFVQLDNNVLAVTTTGGETALVDWLNHIQPVGDDPASVDPPSGYEVFAHQNPADAVSYRGDTIGTATEGSPPPTPPWATVTTTSLESAVDRHEWVKVMYPSLDAEPIGTDRVLLHDEAGNVALAMWQPASNVIVEIYSAPEILERLANALQLEDLTQLDAPRGIDAGPMGGFVDDRTLSRTTLGTTSIGPFAYVEWPPAADPTTGTCFQLQSPMGGSGTCQPEPRAPAPFCLTERLDTTWRSAVLILDDSTATVEPPPSDPELTVHTEHGIADDGTPFTFAWTDRLPADSNQPQPLLVNGTDCTR